jgi:hypothetical protein
MNCRAAHGNEVIYTVRSGGDGQTGRAKASLQRQDIQPPHLEVGLIQHSPQVPQAAAVVQLVEDDHLRE